MIPFVCDAELIILKYIWLSSGNRMVRTACLMAAAWFFLLGLLAEHFKNEMQTISPFIVKMDWLSPSGVLLRCPSAHGGARTRGIVAAIGPKTSAS